ncbi:MAG: L-fucose:H+ symporter permease [Steroidobacter sp.]
MKQIAPAGAVQPLIPSPAAERTPILPAHYVVPFILVTTLFFSWALAAQLNDVLIRQFQKALDLTRGQSGLVQTAFYGGYFLGAIPAALAMRKFGYKYGILIGLALYFIGAVLFYPAAEVRQFGFFLFALYIIAFGLSFLETAANPFVSVMGPSQTSSARLNLAQSFYGIGAFLGPFLGGIFIFSGVEHSPEALAAMSAAEVEAYRIAEAQAVQMPYLVLAAGVAIVAVMIAMTRFPPVDEGASSAPAGLRGSFRQLLKVRHLTLGALTQFVYVGAQVAVWSYFIDFTKDLSPDTTERQAAHLLSFGFLALMVGRFSGAFIMQRWSPHKLLSLYSFANIVLVLVAIVASGWAAIWALWLTIFFMSIMFPTIFTLGVRDLGPLTKIASSFMIMAIIGGAIVPPLVGHMADVTGSLQIALVIPLVGFVAVLAYGLVGHK